MQQYEAYEREREAQLQAAKEKRERDRAEGARRSREYWEKVNNIARAEQEGGIAWFMQQVRDYGDYSPVRLERHTEHVPQYLAEAYRNEVSRRGGTLQMDAYTQRAIADTARWLVSHTKPGLMLRGYIGVGKTTMLLSIAVLFRVVNKQNLRIVDARQLTNLAKDTPKEFEALMKAPLLGIDDLGTEPQVVKQYGNEMSPVAELLAERYSRRAFTIITTNLTHKQGENGLLVDELQEIYGDRLFDRFKEMFNTISYDAEQRSYRQ